MQAIGDLQSLLGRVAKGEILTEEERATIAAAFPGAGEAFALSGDSRPAKITREQLTEWGRIYATEHRQLRRWIKQGELKGDPCPLEDPQAMPAWWSRNMRHSVPAKLLSAAQAAAPPPPSPSSLPDTSPEGVPAPPAEGGGLALSNFEMGEGEEVLQARRLVAAAYDRLEAAYKGGGGDVDQLQRRWEKAQDTLRNVTRQSEESRRRRGDLVPKPEVLRDYTRLADLLKHMHVSMVRRVLELCPSLSAEDRDAVGKAITRVREQEHRIFRNLDTLKSLEDVDELFAA